MIQQPFIVVSRTIRRTAVWPLHAPITVLHTCNHNLFLCHHYETNYDTFKTRPQHPILQQQTSINFRGIFPLHHIINDMKWLMWIRRVCRLEGSGTSGLCLNSGTASWTKAFQCSQFYKKERDAFWNIALVLDPLTTKGQIKSMLLTSLHTVHCTSVLPLSSTACAAS